MCWAIMSRPLKTIALFPLLCSTCLHSSSYRYQISKTSTWKHRWQATMTKWKTLCWIKFLWRLKKRRITDHSNMSTKGFSWTPYSRHASVGGKQGGIQLGCDQYQSFHMLKVFGWGLHAVIAVRRRKKEAASRRRRNGWCYDWNKSCSTFQL